MLLEGVSENNIDVVTEALKYGADINCVDSDGCSVLMLARQQANDLMYSYLLSEGATTNAVDDFGMTAEDYHNVAVAYNHMVAKVEHRELVASILEEEM